MLFFPSSPFLHAVRRCFLKTALSFIDAFSTKTGKAVSVLTLLIAFCIGYEVVMRDFLTRPTLWVSEVTIFGCSLLYLLGGPWTMLTDNHVRVDMLYVRFKPRVRALIDCLTYFAFSLYIVVMAAATFRYAAQSVGLRETTQTPWNPPIYPFKAAMFIALTLVFLQGTAKFIRDLYFVVKGKPL
jgi:TRAP-type mannitol/chloroaromatic compound transport system permease small subunit